jgi:hypothetical protein
VLLGSLPVGWFPPLGVKERDADSLLIFHPSIVAHHRRSGQVFTQDQEEMILIGAFGLFWFGKSQVRYFLAILYGIGSIFRNAKAVPEGARKEGRVAQAFCLRLRGKSRSPVLPADRGELSVVVADW